MPIFEYRCKNCGEVHEFFMLGKEKEVVCPSCGSKDMEKVLSPTSFINSSKKHGRTCCGREERCDKPPCITGGRCRRDTHNRVQ